MKKKSALVLQKDREYLSKTGDGGETKAETNASHKKSLISKIVDYLSGFERYILINIGFIPSHRLRDFLYRRIFLVNMSKGSVIYYGAEIRGPYNLSLGRGAVIGDCCVLDARRGYIKIGNNVQLGNKVSLWTGSHDYNDPYFRSLPGKRGPIEIEDYVWIGPGSTILHSVKIGKGAVIAAGSIVTHDVEPFSVMAGVPAIKVATRDCEPKYDLSISHIPFY